MIKLVVSLGPVLLFLVALVALDSYKLVRFWSLVLAIFAGCIAAILSMYANSLFLGLLQVDRLMLTRYVSPVVEELAKAIYVIYLIKRRNVGFIVDSAILGFAVGAGFALVENAYYLQTLQTTNVLVWVVRGVGTAVIHGGTMAILGIISKDLVDRKSSVHLWLFSPGLAVAIVIHSGFNHFFLSPIFSTVIGLIALPLLIIIAFEHSEKTTRKWLDIGLDTDLELLELISTGGIAETRVGRYLQSLQGRFPRHVVGDMLCYLRLRLELALQARGILLAQEAGIEITPDPDARAKLDEMRFLDRSLGKTGKLALLPLLRTSSRDLWQLHMVGQQ